MNSDPKKVRLAIVGLHFGAHIARTLVAKSASTERIELTMLCDRDTALASKVGAELNVPFRDDLDAVLADPNVDAIGLYTGPVGRAKLIHRIISAGKDVMTTKPFERSSSEARWILEEARRLKRIVHLNSPAPTPPGDLKQILEWRTQYDLGRPIGCHQSVWANYREKADGTWYDDPTQCPAAPIFRLGIYCISDALRMLGKVTDVSLMTSRIFTGRPTADNGLLSLRFEGGAIGSIYASFCIDDAQPYGNSMVLNYERGTIYRNVGPSEKKVSEISNLTLVAHVSQQKIVDHAETTARSGDYQWDAFGRAIAGETLPDSTPDEQIVHGIQIIEAMVASEASGGSQIAIQD